MWLVRFWQIGNVLTTVGGALLLGSHVLVFWAYFIFRLCETLDAHSGYSISLFSALPFCTGAQMSVSTRKIPYKYCLIISALQPAFHLVLE